MLQVENEFGSYGDVSTSAADRRYLEYLVQAASALDVVLYTTDGSDEPAQRIAKEPE